MEAKLRRKLIVSGVGVAAAIGLIVGLYLTVLKSYVKDWQQARNEIRTREKKLTDLRTAFSNQLKPENELNVLQEEIANLTKANASLQKLKTSGEVQLPPELSDPDPQIKKEMYKDYMKNVMENAKEKIKEKLKNAQISPPDIDLNADLKNPDEIAYYINRAAGLQGIIDALAKSRTADGILALDKLTLEDYGQGARRRDGSMNTLSYHLKLTMDTQSLMSFVYNLREQPSFYYIEEMEIKPRAAGASKKQQLDVSADVSTTMVMQTALKAQVAKAAAAAAAPPGARRGAGGFMGLAEAMKQQMEEEKKAAQEKKWYQFWKWFKK